MANGRTSRRRDRAPAVRRPLDVDVPASGVAALVALAVAAAIWFGSLNLHTFDAALVGYAAATVSLAFGVTYRYMVWVKSPPARRYFIGGWRAFLSFRNFRRNPDQVPRSLVETLALQLFIRQRSIGRWLAHQGIFWGVVLATLITFPLTFGWVFFRVTPGTETGYDLYLWGLRLFAFDALSPFGWLLFHGLNVAAVLVIPGCLYYLWRRFRDREAATNQRLHHDLLPLVALLVISVTGLLLTFSAMLLHGRYYDFLAIIHMTSVVLTLVYIPFGKFFHVIQRPAQIGVDVYKSASLERDGVFACRRCGEPMESAGFVRNLQGTMEELDLRYPGWVETCPRCKRTERGAAYLEHVKRGF